MPQKNTLPQTFSIEPRRARNPLVAPALFRHAGAHGASRGAMRRKAARALQRELAELPPPLP